MGIRFRKSIKITNGVKLNVSKSGVSLSLGKKGLHYSVNSHGQSTATASLPGTGLSYQKKFNVFGGLASLFSGDKDKNNKVIEEKNEVVKVNNDDLNKLNDYNEYVKDIKSFHKEVSDSIDWNNVNEDDKETALKVLAKDIDTYLEVVSKYSPMEEISAFGSDFEFGADNPDILNVTFNVKINDVVPTSGLKQDEKGNITEFELKKTQFNDLAQDYVCSCAIRIAREVFALLPIDIVVVNAQDMIFDSSTGNQKDTTILSVLFVRSGFDNINFEMIDPSDFIGRFKSNMSFTKSSGFKEVKEIEIPKLN